jgi:hypothetical protein
MLRVASWIVPRRQRIEWLREWQGEVWHWSHFLGESARLNERSERELLGHCWGAFRDALWYRLNRVALLNFVHWYPLTPTFCILTILVTGSLLLVASPTSPSTWIYGPAGGINSPHLLTVSLNRGSHWLKPELLRDAAMQWAASSPWITKAESYAWRPSVVRGPEGPESVLTAKVTPGVFELLGSVPILGQTFESTDFSCPNCVILTDTIWKDQFHRNSQVIGRSLFLDGYRVKVVGVLPAQFRFPGLDIGLYIPFGRTSEPQLLSFEWPGALLRVPEGVELSGAKRELQAYVNHTRSLSSNITLDVLSLKDIQRQTWETYATWAGIALLLFVALSWSSVVRLCATGPRRNVTESLRWWLFFAVKSSLLMLIVLTASVDLVQIAVFRFGLSTQDYAGGTLMWLCSVGLTIALTWSVRDQLSRCRTCLSRLRTQIELGNSVGTFCEPSGVELICDGGHGMLHLPVMAFSCLDSVRWTELDESWQAVSGT